LHSAFEAAWIYHRNLTSLSTGKESNRTFSGIAVISDAMVSRATRFYVVSKERSRAEKEFD
jgi:hypothetical protein